jgi:hypothetical protein
MQSMQAVRRAEIPGAPSSEQQVLYIFHFYCTFILTIAIAMLKLGGS